MAIGNGQVTVTAEAIVIIADDKDGQEVLIKNIDENGVYLGDSSVTVNNGFLLEKDETIKLFLGPSEEIYGVVVEDTTVVTYLATMNQ
jgi:hypothetical protein